jgi:hypothetical protein
LAEARQCCSDGGLACGTSQSETNPTEDLGVEESGHKSPGQSKECRCGTYLCYDGNALLPLEASNVFSTADKFYRHTPGTFAGSGWVYQTFHPPR